ncbi:hypothetical protein Godav_003911 [Gossypium davidsonii]|uniref:Uncharacterized protein n=1 Tax=Gossypium davidsonii TaxID=34287 RepID=A0A7J8SJX4_GOSDV|nr:hypothetical protein [Gossypium davidsonii]
MRLDSYSTLIMGFSLPVWCSKIQVDRAYSRAVSVPTFLKKLMNIIGMSKQWVAARIK